MGMELVASVTTDQEYIKIGNLVKGQFFPNYTAINSTWCIVCRYNDTTSARPLRYIVGNYLNGSLYSTKMYVDTIIDAGSNNCAIGQGAVLELWAMDTDNIYNRYNVG